MQNLRTVRKDLGYSQTKVAEFLNISQQSYSDYENGKTFPDPDTLIKIADFFHVSIDYLLGRADDLGTIAISPSPALELTAEERELVDTFRRMTKETQAITLDTVHSLAGDNERGKIVLNKRA